MIMFIFQLFTTLNFTERLVYLCSNSHIAKLNKILHAIIKCLNGGDPYFLDMLGTLLFCII